MAAERKIGGIVYRCDKLPASDGLKLFMRVTSFFKAAPDMMASIAAANANKVAISAFLGLVLSSGASSDETDKHHDLLVNLAELCMTGTDQCVVGVKPAGIEDLIQVAWFAMEVNFKDFLSAGLADS